MKRVALVLPVLLALLGPGTVVRAQDRPSPSVEVVAGWAGFVDERLIHRGVICGAARVPVTARVSVGPEFLYVGRARGRDDLVAAANVFLDLTRNGGAPVVPYVVGGAGVRRLTERIGPVAFTDVAGVATGGLGARLRLGSRVYVAPEVRFGTELHWRATLAVGIRVD